MNLYEGERGIIIEGHAYPRLPHPDTQAQVALSWDDAAKLYRQLLKWIAYFESATSPAVLWTLAEKGSDDQ